MQAALCATALTRKRTRCRALALGLAAAVGIAGLTAGWSARAQSLEGALPAAARLVVETREDGASVPIPVAPLSDGAVPLEIVVGVAQRRVWQIQSAALTPAQAMAPIRAALEAQGFAPVLDCDARLCGGFAFRFETDTVPPPDMFVDLGAYRYLAARRDDPDGPQWATVMVSRSDTVVFVQLSAVYPGVATPVEAPVALAAALPDTASAAGGLLPDAGARGSGEFARSLRIEGRVVLSELTFAPGAATLAEAGDTALAALAAFLEAAPDARVVLVGHTDAQGALSANVDLSRRRAEAVRAELINRFGVEPGQIGAEGVGYLMPLTSNATAAGRELNRRVEVVLEGIGEAPRAGTVAQEPVR